MMDLAARDLIDMNRPVEWPSLVRMTMEFTHSARPKVTREEIDKMRYLTIEEVFI
jgi:hypothetical protein